MASVLLLGVSAVAGAQKRAAPAPILGNLPGEKHVAPRNGFDLLANADLAASGMRNGAQFYWAVSNIGPCADGHVLYGDGFGCGGYTGSGQGVFEVVLAAGVPISDFRKIRAVHQGVNNHLGTQGFTMLSTHLRVGAGSQDWGPADGSFGTLFKGEVSTNDGTCRDNTGRANNFMGTNVTLLAGSDCPITWANTGFDGPRPIGDSAFIRLKNAQGNAFTFDYFKVPAADRDNSKFLGSFSTYGAISDYFTEALQSYGSVTPKGGTRKPARNGYPIGLDVRFEAFTFNRPQIANAVFWQMTVVNNSKNVYGQGIDYDSLYMGVMNGVAIAGDQGVAQYSMPHRNGVFFVRNGQNTGCNGATPGGNGFYGVCQNQGFRNSHGFGVIMLKSPIGDVRNKLLTRPGPFNNPSSPYADDTITFNHKHACGFGLNCHGTTMGLNDRRGFGMISSTEENVLDGRDPGSLTAGQQWVTFRPKAHPIQPNAKFNRYVPGNWTYENRPPGLARAQDTLFLDECDGAGSITVAGQPHPRCSVFASDTMPGKQLNAGPGNVGGVMTAGPFPLKAGDTTSFVISWFAARDSAGFEALANAITDSYLSFYLGPDAPPAPSISAVQVASAEERDSLALQPFVRLVFSDEPEVFVDPFFARYAQDLRQSQDPFFKRMRNINPKLADTVEKIANNNFAELHIYRSCNNGLTFSLANCVTAPTIGPNGTTGLGFRPYAILRADANGNIPNTFTDNQVLPGITYLYSLVPRSRGLTIAIRDVDPTDQSAACLADTTFTACKKIERIFTVADTASASIATSGPSVVRVYVPVSVPAGGRAATTTVSTRTGTSTLPVNVTMTGSAISGDYRLVFGNRFIIQQVINTTTNQTTSMVRVQDTVASANVNGTPRTNYIESETVLSGAGALDFTGFAYTPAIATGVGTRVETDTASGFGFVLAQGNRPLYVSLSVIDTGTTRTTPETFTRRTDFPGFLVSLNQRSADTLQLDRIVEPDGDSIPVIIQNANAVQFRQENTTRVNGRGLYSFTFTDNPVGHGGPFRLGGTSESIGATFNASILGRTNSPVQGDTSARIKAIVGGTFGPRLVPMRFPFTVTSAAGNPIILAAPARTVQAGVTNTYLLGNAADTVRVVVDSLHWLPGDPFVVLEVVDADSLVGGAVAFDAAGARLTQKDTVIAFNPTVLGCNTPRVTCNPIEFPGPGATGFLRFDPGTKIVVNYPRPFTVASDINIRVNAANNSAGFTRSSLSKVRVVPNPYVVQSLYDEVNGAGAGDPRLMFTGLPARGTIRIYSVSGQFLQQLVWTAADLEGDTGTSGDLKWNMRTREGTLIAGGLYIYVLTSNDDRGKQVTTRGKFVVIR
jgi:hypothetical protein